MPLDEPDRHKKDSIRILRIIARLNIGGPAIQAITLSDSFNRGSYKTLLVCGRVGQKEGDMIYFAHKKGVKPYILDEMGREISLLNDLKLFFMLRKIMKEFNPHIIHTHTAKAGTVGRLACLSLKIFGHAFNKPKMIHTFHGHIFHSYFGSFKTRIFILIERFLGLFTDRIIVLSKKQYHDICNKYRITRREKVITIPLGFDLSLFEEKKEPRKKLREKFFPSTGGDIFFVGIIGRLTHIKNHRMFLDSIRSLKDAGKVERFRFLIIGDGELREELLKYSEELNIKDYVAFTGWIKDMPSLYTALDMVVLTSYNEGTPVALIEAMAAGLPVVATDVGGVHDLMGNIIDSNVAGFHWMEYGILVPSGRSEILGKALIYVIENMDKVNEKATMARQNVLENYSFERLVKDIRKLYSETLCAGILE